MKSERLVGSASVGAPGFGPVYLQIGENEFPSCRVARCFCCFDYHDFLIAAVAELVRGERARFVDELAAQARVRATDERVPVVASFQI